MKFRALHHYRGTADWHEREAYDLMGVKFVKSSDLREYYCLMIGKVIL